MELNKILSKYFHEHLLVAYVIMIMVLLGGFLYFIFPLKFNESEEDNQVSYEIENPSGILEPKVVIDNKVAFNVKIADEPHERARGLSGVTFMEEYQGMLFFFQEYNRYTFWMKDMEFDLDFIWIRDNVVVDIDTYASSDDDVEETLYSPLEDVNFVLEVNAGLVEKYGIAVGDPVMYHNIVFVPLEDDDIDKN